MTEQNLFSDLTQPKTEEVLHIEVGAGKNEFGRKYYPLCYLTDKNESYRQYVDEICDACNLPFADNRFKKVIACNPFMYGFKYKEEGEKLLTEFTRVLSTDGKIILIGASANPYINPKRIQELILKKSFEMEVEEINSAVLFSGHVFYVSNHERETRPDRKITINVRK